MKKITSFNSEFVTQGERLRIAREKLGITQEQLAEILGCQCITIGRYERDESPNGLKKNADKLAGILNVNVDWLLGKSEYSTTFDKNFAKLKDEIELIKSFGEYLNVLKDIIKYSKYDIETQLDENKIKGYEIKENGKTVGIFSVEDFNTMAFEICDYVEMYITHFLERNNPTKTKKTLDKTFEILPTLTIFSKITGEENTNNGNNNPTNK